ncbi:MAG: carboxylesterase family protein [Deltaproteobacteria bacterium]|nr:carboxylesterase family protein [Deltaproteobacteria bacterium]
MAFPPIFTAIFLALAALPLALSLAATSPALAQAPSGPRVGTKSGPVIGVPGDGVTLFKGIPFAAPPVGVLRFAPPKDPEPWTEPREADAFGPIPPQPLGKSYFRDTSVLPPPSEDCLNLNIWVPEGAKASDGLPVYMFIPGGGFAIGAGSQPLYDGTTLAKAGIVVVTMNYRLGALGFLASRETLKLHGTTGNWGILDQIKALEWVRDNIAAFGGDPAKVTVGGESAGSMSVSALILSPLAKGLFRGAIMESGTFYSMVNWPSNFSHGKLGPAMDQGSLIMEVLGLKDDPQGLEALRSVPPEVLERLCPFGATCRSSPFSLAPVFDGKVLPRDPQGALASGDINRVKILMGYNRDEANSLLFAGCTESDLEDMTLFVSGPRASEAFWGRFPAGKDDQGLASGRRFMTFTLFSAGAKRVADLHSRFGEVYLYNFEYSNKESEKEGLAGAFHTSELPLVFGNMGFMGYTSTPEELRLGEDIRSRWVNFIKTGDPNQGDPSPTRAEWPAYDPKDPKAMAFGTKVGALPLPGKDDLDFMADTLYGPLPGASPK